MAFLTGPFQATYNAKPLGAVEGGFEHIWQMLFEDIRPDQYKGMVNGVFTGIDMTIRTVLMEADLGLTATASGLRDLIWPFSDSTTIGTVTKTGQLISTFAKPLVLTPCSNTNAATQGSILGATLTSITFPLVLISADPIALKYANELRKIPLSLIVLPSETVTSGSGLFPATAACGTKTYFTMA